MHLPSMLIGAVGALVALSGVVELELRHGLERLDAGDGRALLAGFADDAVPHFHDGAHRWSGSHVDRGDRSVSSAPRRDIPCPTEPANVAGTVADELVPTVTEWPHRTGLASITAHRTKV